MIPIPSPYTANKAEKSIVLNLINFYLIILSAFYKPSKKINRDKLIEILYKKYSIKCEVQYYPLYKYPLFKKMGFSKHKCPNTEIFFKNMISFPFHVWMSNKDFNYLSTSIKKSISQLKIER